MTWGQLRFQLVQTAGPSISLDLLEGWLNARYEQVLGATDWVGLRAHATVQTTAAYQSGADTVTLTVGSTAVTGVGTAWVQAAVTGMKFYRPGDTVTYTATWISGTALTLDRPYEGNGNDPPGTVYSGTQYVLMQNVYTLPADCATVVGMTDPVTGYPLTRFSETEMDASVGARTLVADPASYCVYDDSAESNPPVLHQVELYPPPLKARGVAVAYRRGAFGFDPTNPGASPLPFVSSAVLLYGARADVYAHLGQMAQAQACELKFQEELRRLLLVEHAQRREKPKMRMADRFTRHRFARATRGWSNTWGPGQGGPN